MGRGFDQRSGRSPGALSRCSASPLHGQSTAEADEALSFLSLNFS
jgi:hypothetical protein